MRAYYWVGIGAFAALLAAGATALLGTNGAADPKEEATGLRLGGASSEPLVSQAQVNPPPTTAPAGTPSPTGPQRVETTVYDSWAVTCQDIVGGTAKKTCVASLRVMNQNRRQPLLNWQIGFNPENKYVTAVHVPPGLTVKKDDRMVGGALLIPNGVELKFGNGPVRRLNYASCGPQDCLAEAPIDDGFIKEALANTKATVTVHTPAGPVPFDLSIKGVDKAISSTRR